MHKSPINLTSDKLIRSSFRRDLENKFRNDPEAIIIEELGISHGAARVDIALINGNIHGYELKSDLDTLARLPEQMRVYNLVLDQITLVVGKTHLYEAINYIPEWWGIILARSTLSGQAAEFYNIREAEENSMQDASAVASLLWKEEALAILEKRDSAQGFRSKPRRAIYERLAEVLEVHELKAEVRHKMRVRSNWRSEILYTPNDDLSLPSTK